MDNVLPGFCCDRGSLAPAAPRARVTSAAFSESLCAAFRSRPRKEEGAGFKTRGEGSRWSLFAWPRLAGSRGASLVRAASDTVARLMPHKVTPALAITCRDQGKRKCQRKSGSRNDRNLAGLASEAATFSPGYLESESGMSEGRNPTFAIIPNRVQNRVQKIVEP